MKIIWQETHEICKVRTYRGSLLKEAVSLNLNAELHHLRIEDGDAINDIILYFNISSNYIDNGNADAYKYFNLVHQKFKDSLQSKHYPFIENNTSINKDLEFKALRWAIKETDDFVKTLKCLAKDVDYIPLYIKGGDPKSLQEIFDDIKIILIENKNDYNTIFKEMRYLADKLDIKW